MITDFSIKNLTAIKDKISSDKELVNVRLVNVYIDSDVHDRFPHHTYLTLYLIDK